MNPKHSSLRLVIVGVVVAALLAGPAAARERIEKGDIVVTQESPRARHQQHSRTAGAAIFVLKPSGKVETIARPPAVTGPRGVRMDRDGSFVFADVMAPGIGRLTRDSKVKWLHRGAPFKQPKDVAIDRDGGYVVADFPGFERKTGAQILKISPSGKVSTVYRGAPLVWPHGIAVDKDGNYIIADHICCIYRLTPAGKITLVAKGGPLIAPQDIKIDADGSYVVTDIVTVLNRSGQIDRARSRHPTQLLRIQPSGRIAIIASLPRARFRAVTPAADRGYLVVDMNAAVYHYQADGSHTTLHHGAPLLQPAGIAVAQ
jgi:sugar lactone lactonase YvrE